MFRTNERISSINARDKSLHVRNFNRCSFFLDLKNSSYRLETLSLYTETETGNVFGSQKLICILPHPEDGIVFVSYKPVYDLRVQCPMEKAIRILINPRLINHFS